MADKDRSISRGKANNPLRGLSAEQMYQKVREVVDQHTDAEVRMDRDGSYKVFAVTKKSV